MQSYLWKRTLQPEPKNSQLSLVRLYDLIYDESSANETNILGSPWSSDNGIKLKHDIICYATGNKKYINTILEPDNSTYSKDATIFGIDISIPRHDLRAKHKFVECNAEIVVSGVKYRLFAQHLIDGVNKNGYYIYDKDSCLAPSTLEIFNANGVRTANRPTAAFDGISTETTHYTPPTVGISADTSASAADIILTCEDTSFKSTLITADGFYAYNKIKVNTKSVNFVSALVYKACGLNPVVIESAMPTYFWTTPQFPPGICINTLAFQNATSTSMPIQDWVKLLKNTYVWVKAPFYADYIQPEPFNQDLNQDSKVVHSELMLSSKGDFSKYDPYYTGSYTTTDSTSSENTEPYIPQTSPTVDFLTAKVLQKIRAGTGDDAGDDEIISSKLTSDDVELLDTFISEEIDGNTPALKGIPLAPIGRGVSETQDAVGVLPPNYFDPESRKTGKDYVNEGKLPTVLEPDGNAYIDGRIISPTIDELWYIVKKIISGREADENIPDRLTDKDIGLPIGTENRANPKNTSLTEVPVSEFNFAYDKIPENFSMTELDKVGDPIGYTMADNDGSRAVKITKFVNQNNTIAYPIFEQLKRLSKDITSVSGNEDRGVSNFTAWVSNANDEEETVADKDVVASVADKGVVVSGIWSPREVPYSMRELEAIVLSNKFNINTFARFVKENFGVTGGLGKVVKAIIDEDTGEEDASQVAAGALYQFHKSYNFDVANPNTYFGDGGATTELDDKTDGSEVVGIGDVSRGFQRKDLYGTSAAISPDQNKISSSDVYLAADGTWRYVGDHVRIPILRCDY